MDDVISRQAAIDAVNRAVTKEAARWSIQELPSEQPKQQWIPCSDGMPTELGKYFITQKVPYGLRVTTTFFDGDEFWD